MSETIFDKIIAKKIPAKIVFEDESFLAFHDINPQAKIHVLVIPKKKVASFNDLSASTTEDVGLFFKGISRVAQELGLKDSGYRVVFNCGKHGQQTVEYIHAHILGGRQLSWPPG